MRSLFSLNTRRKRTHGLIWCLVALLPCLGLGIAQRQALGPLHVHVHMAAADAGAALRSAAQPNAAVPGAAVPVAAVTPGRTASATSARVATSVGSVASAGSPELAEPTAGVQLVAGVIEQAWGWWWAHAQAQAHARQHARGDAHDHASGPADQSVDPPTDAPDPVHAQAPAATFADNRSDNGTDNGKDSRHDMQTAAHVATHDALQDALQDARHDVTQAYARAAPHAHAHDAWQRHHHAVQDSSVMALDAPGEDVGAQGAAAAMLLPVLGSPARGLHMAALAAAAQAWPRAGAVRFSSRAAAPPLQPPRG